MATYQFVPEHNGIEIYFDVKPSEDVLDELRGNGWRWHRVKHCWFAKKNPQNEQFAKTLCNESSCLKPPAKKESPPTEIEEVAAFNYVNSDQSIFSSVTITRKRQQYTISSTNNQITCCDCNRWISVHAPSCPFCGCPQNYIIEHYFNKYNTQAMAEEKEREQKRLREQQQTEKVTKIQRIQQIGYHFYIKEDLTKELNKLSINDIQVAYNRANYLYSHKEDLWIIMRGEWLSLLTSSESSYQQQIAKLWQEKQLSKERAERKELQTAICKNAYNIALSDLQKLSLAELRLANERAQYIKNSKEFAWGCATLEFLTADDFTYQELLEVARQRKKQQDEEERKRREVEEFRKRDKLRYYQLNYPQYGLSPEKHMHLSEYQINDIIKKLSKNR